MPLDMGSVASSHSKPEITTVPSYEIVYTNRYGSGIGGPRATPNEARVKWIAMNGNVTGPVVNLGPGRSRQSLLSNSIRTVRFTRPGTDR